MIDHLNRLEKLGYLDVDAWLRGRETRNRLAHEYPDHPETRFAAIAAVRDLANAYRMWCAELNPLSARDKASDD